MFPREVVNQLFMPWIEQQKEVLNQAFRMNSNTAFKLEVPILIRLSFISNVPTLPKQEVLEFLTPYLEEWERVSKDYSKILSWLLKNSNRCYSSNAWHYLIPETLRNAELKPLKEQDMSVIQAAKQDLEYELMRKYLLLGTMV